ncbi:MAG: HNH endonuclease signature motif containing protein [Saprospiraceae bacterium]
MIDTFKIEKVCSYKGEIYYVRDNGAILRISKDGCRKRPMDNQWTFGHVDFRQGYLVAFSNPVHRIVATAFHGKPPTEKHVVDHIDTNRGNNRPENLRWVTRLENILLNPITIKRIEKACGCSIEEFLQNPSLYKDTFQEPNFRWMGQVSYEEGQTTLLNLQIWASNDKSSSGGTLGQWIMGRGEYYISNEDIFTMPKFSFSLTPHALQNWDTPTEFPLCPFMISGQPLIDYHNNLVKGMVFCTNKNLTAIIDDFAISDDNKSIWVLSKNDLPKAIKPYLVAKVCFDKGNFEHYNLGSFFKQDGGLQAFIRAQGKEWTGGETFDEMAG